MGCSSWATMLTLPQEHRDEIEVAALLHDIGKIGVPDQVLLKPGRLSGDEHQAIEQQRLTGVEILRSCSASQNVLDIILHSGDWFDGSLAGQSLAGDYLPLGARMVAIVDAFDAMTTDQVYRRAMSRERAMVELFEFAGTQFDPRLVQDFCSFVSADQVKLGVSVARRWLKDLHAEDSNALWRLATPRLPESDDADSTSKLFQHKLLESMHDAVIFVDDSRRITLWNRAAERLTGIAASSVHLKLWSPELLTLRDERQKLLSPDECPLAESIRTGESALRRLSLLNRGGQRVEVDVHLVPVHGKGGTVHGATLLLHDASTQITLEQRLKSLHEKATRDPLTQIANRAEFDRTLENQARLHLEKRLPFSLIICDIDHFKRINDNFGHQAGDAVLIQFAGLLKRHCRPGDLVARYGGEEFVLICSDCSNATALTRAEEIRHELEQYPQPALAGKCITASFGVTELQDGDTPETMLRRADRGLYQAKENGRNTVVQLGSGISGEAPTTRPRGWLSWLRGTPVQELLQRTLTTAVPLNMVVEKLRGFVADHHAEVEPAGANRVALRIDGENLPQLRRTADRGVPFIMELQFEEAQLPAEGRGAGVSRTLVHVAIRPQRGRDRRQRDVLERARQLLESLKSYLVAQEMERVTTAPNQAPEKVLDRAKKVLTPWLGKKG